MIPPRWLLRAGWALHKAVDRISGGHLSTFAPRGRRLGVLFLSTVGRRSGKTRRNALNYLVKGSDFVVMASNAGAARDPAWWANLQTHPDATVEVGGVAHRVRARRATEAESADAWRRFIAASGQYASYPRMTEREIPIVILEKASGQRNVPKEPPPDP